MSELLLLEPLEVDKGIWLPGQQSIVYPGQDAWLQLERGQSAPGADPPWVNVQKCPDTPGTPAIPGKVLNTTTTAPVLSSAQSVFGGQSLLLTGIGNSLTSPDHADWDFGSGDFTLEGRFCFTAVRKAFFAQQNRVDQTDRSWEWTMDVMPSATPGFTFYCNDASAGAVWDHQYDQAFTVNLNQWYHMACVRSGASLMFFVDGVLQGSPANIGSTVIRNSGQPLTVLGDARTDGNSFQGYVDELRISKGIARWTSNFTPPAAAYTVDSYTKLLCHFNGLDGATPTSDDTGVPAGPSTPFDPGSNPAWVHVES